MAGSLDDWCTGLLAARSDKTWTPELYAHPDTAARVPVVAGYAVAADDKLPAGVLEIRASLDLTPMAVHAVAPLYQSTE